MAFKFDEKGFLQPAQPIEATREVCEQFFVHGMKDSETRQRLWSKFVAFIERFQQELTSEFKVWLDGSFITMKLNPKDIDAVFLLDYLICERKKSVLDNWWFTAENKLGNGLDLYYSVEYPESHKRHFLTHLNHLYWLDVYSHTRRDSFGQQHPKGFVELKFI